MKKQIQFRFTVEENSEERIKQAINFIKGTMDEVFMGDFTIVVDEIEIPPLEEYDYSDLYGYGYSQEDAEADGYGWEK